MEARDGYYRAGDTSVPAGACSFARSPFESQIVRQIRSEPKRGSVGFATNQISELQLTKLVVSEPDATAFRF